MTGDPSHCSGSFVDLLMDGIDTKMREDGLSAILEPLDETSDDLHHHGHSAIAESDLA